MESPGIRVWILAVLSLILLTIAGCKGDDGEDGLDGETVVVGVLPASSATELEITIDEVTVASPPVVSFTATDGGGTGVTGLKVERGGNLRFTIATLIPGTNGDPSYWKSYIENSSGQATYERDGVLEELGNGSYTYTFETDITQDPDYDPSRRHRLAMQIDDFPPTNPVEDFRPDGGDVDATASRDIVKTGTCNACHNQLAIHGGGRIEMKYCTQCHTPATIDPDTGNTVDFPVMTHKIHMGEDLPSVIGGTPYQIIGYGGSVHDYSTVVFPQDIRNCTTCHDGSDPDTPQGDNWNTQPSIKACGSCHDDIDFSKDGTVDPDGHPGGSVTDNSECLTCHASGRIAGSVEESHELAVNTLVTQFQFNIIEVCGDPVATSEPDCTGTPVTPTVTFSVTDPSNGDAAYDVVNDSEFGSGASLNILTAWDSEDYSNDGGSGSRPSRANSFSLSSIQACVTAGVVCSANADGSFTVQVDALPAGVTSGSGGVAIEGHPRGESDPGVSGFDTSVPVSGEVAYFGINGDPMVERRVAVDILEKCDKCHGILSLHGNNRAENNQLCVMCHNPRGTDIQRRDLTVSGVPDISSADGKREETIDMKVMIHAIHAGQQDDPNTSAVEGHGVREKGIVVYGYGNRVHDYSHVRYPGILNDCTACHNSGTYELEGKWESPMQNGILATTVESSPDHSVLDKPSFDAQMADQTDDLFTSPTAAVCSACHDSDVAKAHMEFLGGAKFEVDLATVNTSFETCSVCHGPDKISDLNEVHGID